MSRILPEATYQNTNDRYRPDQHMTHGRRRLVAAAGQDCHSLLRFLRSKYGADGISEVDMTAAPSRFLGQRWTVAAS